MSCRMMPFFVRARYSIWMLTSSREPKAEVALTKAQGAAVLIEESASRADGHMHGTGRGRCPSEMVSFYSSSLPSSGDCAVQNR